MSLEKEDGNGAEDGEVQKIISTLKRKISSNLLIGKKNSKN